MFLILLTSFFSSYFFYFGDSDDFNLGDSVSLFFSVVGVVKFVFNPSSFLKKKSLGGSYYGAYYYCYY